jgi:hypothetical protein
MLAPSEDVPALPSPMQRVICAESAAKRPSAIEVVPTSESAREMQDLAKNIIVFVVVMTRSFIVNLMTGCGW